MSAPEGANTAVVKKEESRGALVSNTRRRNRSANPARLSIAAHWLCADAISPPSCLPSAVALLASVAASSSCDDGRTHAKQS